MQISLTVTAGPHEGQVFSFEGHDTFIVGRSKRSHFRLPHKDKYFSRVHFMVEVNPPFCRLMDMGSTNGTYVNGLRVQKPTDLKHGDEIRAGKTVLQVNVEDPEGAAQFAPPAALVVPPPRPEAMSPYTASPPSTAMPDSPMETPFPRLLPVEGSSPLVAPTGFEPPGPPVSFPAPEPAPWAVPPRKGTTPTPTSPGKKSYGTTPSTDPGAARPSTTPTEPPAPPRSSRPPTMPAFPPSILPPPREPEPPPPVPGDVFTPSAPPLPFASARLTPSTRQTCVVCLSPYTATPSSAGTESSAPPPPICPTCAEQLRNQHQPIAGYQVLRKLGHGGMGVVHLALRLADNTLVALKTIIPSGATNQTKVERFLREADILHELKHPNIVEFREMGESNGQLYFAMDYVPGIDASHVLKQNGGPMAIGRGVDMVCQLLDALDYAHGKGFVHRDIKPANLMVTMAGGKEQVKLADFGLARVYQASDLSGLTMMGDMGGTLAFMAPEQITHFREAKPPADLYASAATLYNLLTDKFIHDLPKAAEQRLLMILTGEAIPITRRRADIPEGLAGIIHRALAKDAELRFADAKTMRKALLPFAK